MIIFLAIVCFVVAAYLVYIGLTDTYSDHPMALAMKLANPYSVLIARLIAGSVPITIGIWLLS